MKELLFCHITAYSLGCLLDLIIGDPHSLPHPIRWIGSLIGMLDRKLLGDLYTDDSGETVHAVKKERIKGLVLSLITLLVTGIIAGGVLIASYRVHMYLGIAVEAIMTAYILACKSLRDESMKVYKRLKENDLEGSRFAVSMIVGRDTDCLDEAGITKAAVETVAENTSDGVIAPLLYTWLGGPVLGFLYKSVNTCDSMVGYMNDRYRYFGTASAKLDDMVNYLPARLSAWLLIFASFFMGENYNPREGIRIFRRDRYNHKSPNSAQTESSCAGILGVELAGDARYFGNIVHKPTIGDHTRDIEKEDIPRACRLMYGATIILFVMEMLVVFGIWMII